MFFGNLYKKGVDGSFLRCVDKEQHKRLLEVFHSEECGGNFFASVIAFNILCHIFYWPGMFTNAYEWVSKCEKCLKFTGILQLVALPLKPMVIDEPFQ